MTIRELKNAGIKLQGEVKVSVFEFESEELEKVYVSNNMNGENIQEEVLDCEVGYIYAEDNAIVIEVEKK